jgi:hypothetical protein
MLIFKQFQNSNDLNSKSLAAFGIGVLNIWALDFDTAKIFSIVSI